MDFRHVRVRFVGSVRNDNANGDGAPANKFRVHEIDNAMDTLGVERPISVLAQVVITKLHDGSYIVDVPRTLAVLTGV